MDKKTLYRSRKNHIIAGVCGGLAEYFDVDPTIVRIIFVILTLWGGLGLILYIIGMILIPYEGEEMNKSRKSDEEKIKQKAHEFGESVKSAASDFRENVKEYHHDHPRHRHETFGLLLILIGLLFLLRRFVPWFDWNTFWPLVLIVIGILIIAGNKRGAK